MAKIRKPRTDRRVRTVRPSAPSAPALRKVPTGIQGFDEITHGGLPRGRTTLVTGGAGSGKTVFALQSLVHGAVELGEAGIFVAFEESAEHIHANAAGFGWDLPALTARKLFFLDARLAPEVVTSGEFDLIGMLSLLELKAKELHATHIVFDGIDVLLTLLGDSVLEQRELYRISAWLTRTGLTATLTQKLNSRDADPRYQFVQFMVDCVVSLRHEVVNGSAYRNLRVVKYRGSGFEADEFPITLTDKAMQLTNRGPAELTYDVTDERVSSGLPRLDHMLSGGYYRGSSILVSGAPGTAKSTLCGLFADAACQRGERTLYVSFDEGADQIVRNVKSIGINLERHRKSGLLQIYSTRTRGPNVEDQYGALRERVLEHRARCLVIDPLSALTTKQEHVAAADASQHFLDFLKREGITVLSTSLMDGLGVEETTASGISTIADTWIHLSYLVQDGERNRALTIVKSRGTGHSNQVREMTLSDEGVGLTDVFVAHGKVLMGLARWEQEQSEREGKSRGAVATELRRVQLRLAQAEAAARLLVVKTEMEARTAEIELLEVETGKDTQRSVTGRAVRNRMRRADEDTPAKPNRSPATPRRKPKPRRSKAR